MLSVEALPRARWSQRMVALAVAAFVAVGLVTIAAGAADARINGTRGAVTKYINGCGMPNVKVRYWKRPGNYKTVVLLDGMRAGNNYSGWEAETNVQEMVKSGVNVVEPIGGMASFYTNWSFPNNYNGQRYRYMWECVIGQKLPAAMDSWGLRVGKKKRYSLAGISMGGGAALILAGRYKWAYDQAFSMSGYTFTTAPGMRTWIRIGMLDAGSYVGRGAWNVDSMWGPPWSPRWPANDPTVQAGTLRGVKTRVAAGTGLWDQNTRSTLWNNFNGSYIEFLAMTQARGFQASAAINGVPVSTDFPITGTHTWGAWQDMLWRAKNTGWFRDR